MGNFYDGVADRKKWRGYYLSAYGIAVKNGFEGSELEWLVSLGAYGIACKNGFEGSEEDWLASLRGEKGAPFTYKDFTEEQLQALKSGAIESFLAEAEKIKSDTESIKTATEGIKNDAEDVLFEVQNEKEAITSLASRASNAADEAYAGEVNSGRSADRAEIAKVEAEAAATSAEGYASDAKTAAEKAGRESTKANGNIRTTVQFYKKTFENTSPNKLTELMSGYVTDEGVVYDDMYFYRSNKFAVSAGETITYQATPVYDAERVINQMEYVTAYDAEDNPLPDLGGFRTYSYTVPEGVAYIICSLGYDVVDNYWERAIVASDTVIPYSYILKPSAIPYLKNDYSNAIKGTLSGEAVAAKDVSPIEHDLKVKLTAEGASPEGVTVSRCGKNLFDISKIGNYSHSATGELINNGDGSITINLSRSLSNITSNTALATVAPSLVVGRTYTLSAKTTGTAYYIRLRDLSDTNTLWHYGKNLTITEDHLSGRIYFYAAGGTTDGETTVTISDIQIELGEAATAYEPYIEPQSAVSDADGNVSGLVSLSPSMTLMSDTEGVTINCEYNRDAGAVVGDLMERIAALEAAAASN